MGALMSLIASVCGLGYFICFILVLIQMFKRGQMGLGIACIVLAFCGIGTLIAFIMGWINAAKWDIKNIMLVWTVCLVVGVLTGGGGSLM